MRHELKAFLVISATEAVACLPHDPAFVQSFILAETTPADMLDEMVYYMLSLVSAGTAVFMLAEIMWPESFFTSCGR